MKKLLLIFLLFGFALSAGAQSFGDGFKLDIGMGYAKPTEGFGVKPGVTFIIEPHLFVSKNFSVGARFEGALLGYQADYNDEFFSFFGSTCVTGEVYLSRGVFRPFLGVGGGLFTRHYIFPDYYGDGLYTSGFGSIKLGAFGRAGFEIGHIRFAATYNVIDANFRYAAVTVGYVLGN